MAEKKERLFDMFPPVSTEEWRAKVEADLKGAPFDKKLVWRTSEGFSLQPMYRAEDIEGLATTDSLPGEFPFIRGTRDNNDWLTRQEIIADSPEEANAKALDVLSKGVNSLGFKVDEPTRATLEKLLEGIDLKKVEINLQCCPKCALPLAEALMAFLADKNLLDEFRGSINFNPMRKALNHGKPFPGDICAMAKALVAIVKDAKNLRVLPVNAYLLSNAGAYIYQELGYALSWGAQWMTMLTDAGLDANEVARRIKFNMGISSNYFMELAKFRALRMLWAQIAKQYGCDDNDCKAAIHATTSRFNQTIYDAHVNLLRSQTEAMSAALAGVDSITVTPFDTPYKKPDDFSERIARNQQLLLKEESHLDKVVDPAGGSYYIETLTVNIAREAWKLFLDVEENGGFLDNINNGKIQSAVAESSEKRHTDVARRKEILLGTNQYPNINEFAAEKIVCDAGANSCCCNGSVCEDGDFAALPKTRAASDFEALRLATERSGKRPKVFMLTIGNLAMRLARAQFSSNFFGCAGYEIIDNNGFKSVEDGVNAALDKNADVVVLCSSDDEYAEYAPAAFKALDGRAQFVVAGAPACMDDLKAIGINDFIHVRCNVLDVLRDFNNRLL